MGEVLTRGPQKALSIVIRQRIVHLQSRNTILSITTLLNWKLSSVHRMKMRSIHSYFDQASSKSVEPKPSEPETLDQIDLFEVDEYEDEFEEERCINPMPTRPLLSNIARRARAKSLLESARNDLRHRLDHWRLPREVRESQPGTKPQYFQSSLQRDRTSQLFQFYNMVLAGKSRLESSRTLAEVHGLGLINASRNIRKWAREWELHRSLPKSNRGCHSKVLSMLNDPDVCAIMRNYLRSNKWSTSPTKLKSFMNQEMPLEAQKKYALEIANGEMPRGLAMFMEEQFFPRIGVRLKKPFSLRTARRWMRREGFRFKAHVKGIYVDGHDRDDVIAYRQQIFIPKLKELRPKLPSWTDDQLLSPKPTHILVYHDESTFTANDGTKKVWVLDGAYQIRKKGAGRGIHRSDFITASKGWIEAAGEQMQYGKDYEGYWTGAHLAEQLRRPGGAIDQFEILHPGQTGVFLFDNSSGHSIFAEDALLASRIRRNPGQKEQLPMRNGWYNIQLSNGNIQRITQPMVDPNTQQLRGTHAILLERGLLRAGETMQHSCKRSRDHKEDGTCCQQRLLSQQPDFQEQRSLIEEIISSRGHIALFLPKFHCELNIIEYFWGAAKRYTREHCDYTFEGLKRTVPEALRQVDKSTMRRWESRFWRWIEAYENGLNALDADQAIKNYTSHRRATEKQA